MKPGMLTNRAHTECRTWVMQCVGRSQLCETGHASELGWNFPFKLVVAEITAKGIPILTMQEMQGISTHSFLRLRSLPSSVGMSPVSPGLRRRTLQPTSPEIQLMMSARKEILTAA